MQDNTLNIFVSLFFINILISVILMFSTMITENVRDCKVFGISLKVRSYIEGTYYRSLLTIPFTFSLMGLAEYLFK